MRVLRCLGARSSPSLRHSTIYPSPPVQPPDLKRGPVFGYQRVVPEKPFEKVRREKAENLAKKQLVIEMRRVAFDQKMAEETARKMGQG